MRKIAEQKAKGGESVLQKIKSSLGANAVFSALSTLTGICIPLRLGATEYGYWQVIALYLTYLPFFHFGWIDGFYLSIGGKGEGESDKGMIHSQFVLFCLYDILLFSAFCVVGVTVFRASHRLVMILVGVECLIWLPRVFLHYVLQATGRVTLYGRNIVLERAVVASCQLLVLLLGGDRFWEMAVCEMLGKVVAFIALVKPCQDVLRHRKINVPESVKLTGSFFRSGFKVTFATVSGMLLLGIVQFFIETSWPIETFGMVSFALVSLSCAVQFLNQISVVLYPILSHAPRAQWKVLEQKSGLVLLRIAALVMVFYYPLELILDFLLPSYATSIRYLSWMLPVVFFESRTTPVLNTIIKAARKESALLRVNVVMMLSSAVTTIVTVLVLHDIDLVILSVCALLGLRMVLTEIVANRIVASHEWLDMAWVLVLAAASSVGYVAIGGLPGWAFYALVLLAFLFFRRKDLREAKGLLHSPSL